MPSHFHPDKIRDINATVRYVITGQGVWNITVSGGRVIVDQSDRPADATITMSAEDFMGLQSGTLNPMTAFMAGRVAIQGDLDTVLRFQSVFGQ
ncbi:hypothetical protein WM2015_2691 [Wenzhouxiangella marina]|uniref:SCP2 domain-containing protein n=2 Tax=Wenzhouxiangella marina TaxID=1579979 RepID=A0A0K0XZD8_9GAMM|nr:hypothetical protein WM2015_2691 [Wenzhouxiangella marina]